MLKSKLSYVSKFCLTLLSASLMFHSALGNDAVQHYDNLTTSYLYPQTNESSILDMNSSDARTFETTLKLDVDTNITDSTKTINLSLRNSDVKQVLRMLAQKAGVNIVFDESVTGSVTLDLTDVDINEAFAAIFKTCQLTYYKEGNTISVMTQEASKELAFTRKVMTVLPVKYVDADSVAEFLNNNIFSSNVFGLSGNPVVTSNPRSNQIIIFGTQQDVVAIKRVLPVIDTKPHVNTFKVNHTTPKEMATLLCNSLFADTESSGKDSDNSSSNDSNNNSNDSSSVSNVTLGGAKIACRAGKSDNSSSDDSADSSSSDSVKLSKFKSNPLTIAYFSELGQIGVYGGSVEQVEVVKEFIKQNDKKQLMAYVELSVIELNETGSKDFSNEWELWAPFISLSFSPDNGLSTNSNSPFFVWGHEYEATVTQSGDGDSGSSQSKQTVSRTNNHALVYRLRYLVENGNGRVLTNPKIMVTNGQKTKIDMTSDYVKSVTSQVLQSSSSITNATQKTYEIGDDEGLLIEIVPFISPDGYVSMNITPEFATVKQHVYSKSESGEDEIAATLLQRRDLELKNIRIKDGETLVLAGLIKENETQTVKKMPFLSDLPFLGVFFRGNSSRKTREELVIMVTPHIVKDSEEAQYDNVQNL